MFPKPGKKRRSGTAARRDGRVIHRTQYQFEQKVRKVLAERSAGRCEQCGAPAPLHHVESERPDGYTFVLAYAGHAAHIKARKMGGGFRDDRPENMRWLCGGPEGCHAREHTPKKVVPAKARVAA